MRRRKFRFSLRALLALTAIVAVVAAFTVHYQQLVLILSAAFLLAVLKIEVRKEFNRHSRRIVKNIARSKHYRIILALLILTSVWLFVRAFLKGSFANALLGVVVLSYALGAWGYRVSECSGPPYPTKGW
jgi:hypothetical protein